MKKKYWIILFVLIGLISLGLAKVYDTVRYESIKPHECKDEGPVAGQLRLTYRNNDLVFDTIKEVLNSENLKYENFARDGFLWVHLEITVPIGMEEFYVQNVKNELIKGGLLWSNDFTLWQKSIGCGSVLVSNYLHGFTFCVNFS